MAEIVNLRRFRKARARDAEATIAQANRALHGRTPQERQRDKLEAARLERQMEGSRLEKGEDS
ncbi:DUF4169 family protein [Sphingomonas sp.]|uniref:DUF4169 family protein n=1 Tax=Sphingomonas sp. TaxID=28214 RepID=UPI003B3B6C49